MVLIVKICCIQSHRKTHGEFQRRGPTDGSAEAGRRVSNVLFVSNLPVINGFLIKGLFRMQTILANKQMSSDDISKTACVVENFKNCRTVKEVSKNKIFYWDR